MQDKFFIQTTCDRCGESLSSGRMMSMYNTDCLCMKCIDEEKKRADYPQAVQAECEEVLKGNSNYPGIGYPSK